MILYVVRHAKAVARDDWPGGDLDRPLDAKGLSQSPEIARRLCKRLAETTPQGDTSLFSSPSARCRQTLEPLAAELGVDIEPEPLLGDLVSGPPRPAKLPDAAILDWFAERGTEFVDRCLAAGPSSVVACSHGDLIPPLLQVLFDRDGVVPSASGNQKGSFWTLRFADGRLHSADYEPAP